MDDPRLARLKEIAAALPGHGTYWSFAVRGKKFAYYLDNHHGDGRVALTFRTAPGEQGRLVAAGPARFFVPAYIGVRGWVGLWLDSGEVDWDEAERFVTDSYEFVAPKPRAAKRKAC